MNKIGAPFQKQIVEEPVIEPESEIEVPLEEEIAPEEEPVDPEIEKTAKEEVMKVVDVINSLRGEKDTADAKIKELEIALDEITKKYNEKETLTKKQEDEIRSIKDAIKKAIYK